MSESAPLRDKDEDVIKSGALRITWISGAVGGVAAFVTAFNKFSKEIFGDDFSDELKAGVLAVIVLAWALIAVADLMARAKVTAARLGIKVTPAPQGMKVKLTGAEGSDPGWGVSAIRGTEFLITKANKKPKWVKQDEIEVE